MVSLMNIAGHANLVHSVAFVPGKKCLLWNAMIIQIVAIVRGMAVSK
jgi:hypothetical protein